MTAVEMEAIVREAHNDDGEVAQAIVMLAAELKRWRTWAVDELGLVQP